MHSGICYSQLLLNKYIYYIIKNTAFCFVFFSHSLLLFLINRLTATIIFVPFTLGQCVQISIPLEITTLLMAFTYHSCFRLYYFVHIHFFQPDVVYMNALIVDSNKISWLLGPVLCV